MPSSDYGNAVGGGLKLKGAKNAGIKKKTKKSQTSKSSDTAITTIDKEQPENVQKALAEEDDGGEEGALTKEEDVKQYGKTEAQRRFEERRRKRVSLAVVLILSCTDLSCSLTSAFSAKVSRRINSVLKSSISTCLD